MGGYPAIFGRIDDPEKCPKTLIYQGFQRFAFFVIGTVSTVSTVYAAPARLTRRPRVGIMIDGGASPLFTGRKLHEKCTNVSLLPATERGIIRPRRGKERRQGHRKSDGKGA